MNINDLLARLASVIGLDSLALDEHGLCRVTFDNNLAVTLEAAQGGRTLILSSILGPIPPHLRRSLYTAMLEANLAAQSTHGAVFSIDPASDEVVMSLSLDGTAMVYEEFEKTAEGFLNRLETWMERVSRGANEHDPAREPPLMIPGQGFIRP